jgi:hypothetical protein
MMRSPYLLLSLLPLAAPADAAPSPTEKLLEGWWYGEVYQPLWRETTQELMYRSPDGTFTIEFRVYKNCRLMMADKETGRWSATDTLYHTDTETVGGRAIDQAMPKYHDDYRVDALSEDSFTYTHTGMNVRATDHRVPPDFIFPACGT